MKTHSQDSQRPRQDMNQALTRYKSDAVPLFHLYFVRHPENIIPCSVMGG